MQRVHSLNPDWQGGQGIGFQVRRAGDRTLVGHGGSLPGMRTQITFDARDKVGVIVLSNADDGNPGLYVDQAFGLIAPVLARKSAEAAIAPPTLRLECVRGTLPECVGGARGSSCSARGS